MTYYDASVRCGDLTGEAHGIDTLLKAMRALDSLIENQKAKLVSSCSSCTESLPHDTTLWHDWEISVIDFLTHFDEIEWKWRKSGAPISEKQLKDSLTFHTKIQISLDEL